MICLAACSIAAGASLHVPAVVARHAGNRSSPPSPEMTRIKHFHLAWSERYVRLKHGLPVFSRWRVGECAVKLLWAQIRERPDGAGEAAGGC